MKKRVSSLKDKESPFMSKNTKHKPTSIFQKILEDERAIRKCIQKGDDIK